MRRAVAVLMLASSLLIGRTQGGQDLGQPGPHLVGERTVRVQRQDGATFEAQLWYPAVAAGKDTALDRSSAPYPAVSFGHGFVQSVERYGSTLRHLASHGYLVIASRSEGGLLPSHSRFADDLNRCLDYLTASNGDPQNPLFGAVRTDRYGLSGHSMGGGCSLVAASRNPGVLAVANLAAAETNPSAVGASASVQVPVLLLGGSSDGIVSVATNGKRMYDSLPGPRQLPTLAGGWHCGFQDVSSFGCDSGPMPRDQQLLLTRRQLTQFFDLYLKGTGEPWKAVWGPGATGDPQISLESDPRVRLVLSPPTLAVRPRQEAPLVASIKSESPWPDRYEVRIEGPGWVTTRIAEPVELGAGQPKDVVLRLVFGPDAEPSGQPLIVSVRSLRDGGTRAFSVAALGPSERKRRSLGDR